MENIATWIKRRDPLSHKGTHGHALLIAGNEGRMGAAVLAAKGCLRTGTGLLSVNIPKAERYIMQTAIPEAMLQWREDAIEDPDQYTAIGMGPAIGMSNLEYQLLIRLWKHYGRPMVIDADALNLLAQHKEARSLLPPGTILTPHPKEFDRLFGDHKDNNERKETAIQIAKDYPWVIVLKTPNTLVVKDGKCYCNTTGNAGLAKGGSGDVLCGMVLALLAQGYPSYEAACIAVYLHGAAADIALQQQSVESMLATDVIENIGKAFPSFQGR